MRSTRTWRQRFASSSPCTCCRYQGTRPRRSEYGFQRAAFCTTPGFCRDGNGRRGYIRLNTTSYGQPRRVRWSKEVVGQHMDDNGDQVVGCVAYPHYYTRSPLDQTCEVMPPAVEALVSWAHMLAMPYLTKRSQASMPNACELNLYYTAFDSRIGRHRDNFTSQDLVKYLHNGDPSIVESTTNTQEANTSVLIWTAGNAPMELVLSFPRHASPWQATEPRTL